MSSEVAVAVVATVTETKGRPDDEHELTRTLVGPSRPVPRRPDDRPRRDDRRRRAAVDPRGPRLLRRVPRVGRERVPDHVRRLPPARRPLRRPLRAPPAVPARDHALHARVGGVRPRDLAGDARRRARGAGDRRRSRLRRRALADDDALHGARRAREGDGRLRLRRLGRRIDRRPPRRRPHRRARLALDLPRQRAGRDRGRGPLADAHPVGARRDHRREARHRGCRDGHRRPDARGLRGRERERGGLGHGADARAPRRRGCAPGRVPRHRVARGVAARAAPPLPAPEHRRVERRRRPLGRRDVRVVLPLRALHAARARVQPARSGARVPARQHHHGNPVDQHLGDARHALRDQDPARGRAESRRSRASPLRSRAGRRDASSSTCSRR